MNDMKKRLMTKFRPLMSLLAVTSLFLATSCDDDEGDGGGSTGAVEAIFSFTASENIVTFQNASSNADEYLWDFGDGQTSTEESPVHTYESAGTYEVTLTASNTDSENSKSEMVTTQNGGALASKIVGKTWIAARGRTYAYALGPYPVDYGDQTPSYWGWGDWNVTPASSWPILSIRPSLADDEYTFNIDGSMDVDFNGSFWTEFHLWSDTDFDQIDFDLTTGDLPNNAGGVDMTAFAQPENWTFIVDEEASTIKTIGKGSHILNPRFAYSGTVTDGSGAEVTTPQDEVWYDIIRVEEVEGAADTLVLFASVVDGNPLGQFITLHSYENEADIPALMEKEVASCTIPYEGSTAASGFSHAFTAVEDSMGMFSTNGGFTEEYVADPADSEAGNVLQLTGLGSYNNVMLRAGIPGECGEGGTTQRESFTFDAANPEYVVKFDIYIPSTNTFADDALLNTLVVRWVDESQYGANNTFWQHYVYQVQNDLATDEWVSVTFDFANGTSTYGRNTPEAGGWNFDNTEEKSLAAAIADGTNVPDAIHIDFGGDNHSGDGTFYLRNFRLEAPAAE